MEVVPVTYSSFRAIFLESGPSIISIARLFRDFAVRKGFQSKIAATFVLATMIFALAFPTLASAMTGYTSAVEAFVREQQTSNYIRFSEFRWVPYIIYDGDRINRTKDFLVIDLGDGMPIYHICVYSPNIVQVTPFRILAIDMHFMIAIVHTRTAAWPDITPKMQQQIACSSTT
jgi:hypothetical protein